MKEMIHALMGLTPVQAVGLGGSRGLGLATPQSDYDVVLFRHGGPMVNPAQIVDAITPWVDAGSIAVKSGFVSARKAEMQFEFFQNDVNVIAQEVAQAREGKFRWQMRMLYPHGYLSTGEVSHIVYLQLCAEKNRVLSRLREQALPFPKALQHTLLDLFLRQASIAIIHAAKIHKPQEMQYFLAQCSAFVFHLNVVMFALNEQYPVVERGGSQLIAAMAIRPQQYEPRVQDLLARAANLEYTNALENMRALLAEVRELRALHVPEAALSV
jgi:hypothetical protein